MWFNYQVYGDHLVGMIYFVEMSNLIGYSGIILALDCFLLIFVCSD